jgi:hypothetical protein
MITRGAKLKHLNRLLRRDEQANESMRRVLESAPKGTTTFLGAVFASLRDKK